MATTRPRHRQKRPDSAGLALPKVKFVRHGARSALLTDPLDMRTQAGRALSAYRQALVAHVGGNPSTVELELIEQAARLAILARVAWAEVMESKHLANGKVNPALEAYQRITRDQRAVFEQLGIKRQQHVPDLEDINPGAGEVDLDAEAPAAAEAPVEPAPAGEVVLP